MIDCTIGQMFQNYLTLAALWAMNRLAKLARVTDVKVNITPVQMFDLIDFIRVTHHKKTEIGMLCGVRVYVPTRSQKFI